MNAENLEYQKAIDALAMPFVHYIGNQPNEIKKHFYGLREAKQDLQGIAIFDKLTQELPTDLDVPALEWKRREIENYLCYPEVLEAYAAATTPPETAGPLFSMTESGRRIETMRESIQEVAQAMETLGKGSPWDPTTKVSDDFLTPLFEKYFKKLGLPNLMAKKNFHELARLVPKTKMDAEIKTKLDAIVEAHENATPRN
ncbi:MAG: hypothetical protein IH935_12135 [Acidobacteria bacterium]|nr:hypothetical protein [Acidobacteriota bacterium]